MAFQMLRAHLYASESSKAVSPFTLQTCEMVINGAAADVALDLDNFSGTFWTAALADGTYGAVALKIKNALQNLAKGVASTHHVGGNFILYRPRVPAGAESAVTGAYSANYNDTTKLPNFVFATANGPQGTNIIVTWGMTPGIQPITIDLLP
jgi:hypothetical protein